MTSIPRSTTTPYAASIVSPSSASASFSDRRTSNYSAYPFPSTPGSSSNAYGGPNPYGSSSFSGASGAYGGSRGGDRGFNLGRLIKRLFKFPQMDFEVAGWEVVNLMVAPRKVWRQVWYRKRMFWSRLIFAAGCWGVAQELSSLVQNAAH